MPRQFRAYANPSGHVTVYVKPHDEPDSAWTTAGHVSTNQLGRITVGAVARSMGMGDLSDDETLSLGNELAFPRTH